MKLLQFIIFVILFFTGCNQFETTKIIDQVYDFAETSDKTFCNKDSIIGTDCGGGILYLTNKGFALFTFYCYGSDTTIINIGKYQVANNEVICVFDKIYSFYNGFKAENTPQSFDPNNGKIKTSARWMIKLKKIPCNTFEFGFKLLDSRNFVLKVANYENFKNYKEELTSINKIKDLW
jgi:hypothetical protein